MASPTTLNIGEPADERSVDGNSVPCDESSEKPDGEDVYERPKPVKDEYFNELSNVSEQEIEDMIRYQFYREHKEGEEDNTQSQDLLSESSPNGVNSNSFTDIFPAFQIKPDDVWYKIAPAVGAACYGYFSFSVMDPEWFGRPFGSSESVVKDLVWLNAHVGTGLYLYSRKHIKRAPYPRNVLYSLFGSVLFNFGSLIVWGWGTNILPNSPYLRLMFGAVSSAAMLYLGRDYLDHVDRSSSEVD